MFNLQLLRPSGCSSSHDNCHNQENVRMVITCMQSGCMTRQSSLSLVPVHGSQLYKVAPSHRINSVTQVKQATLQSSVSVSFTQEKPEQSGKLVIIIFNKL